MSIRWIRNVLIDGEKTTVEIQLGEKRFGDKCYTRIGKDVEQWFDNVYEQREDVIAEGVEILKRRLAGRAIANPDGQDFDWK